MTPLDVAAGLVIACIAYGVVGAVWEVWQDARWERRQSVRRLPHITDEQVDQQVERWEHMWHHPSMVKRWEE